MPFMHPAHTCQQACTRGRKLQGLGASIEAAATAPYQAMSLQGTHQRCEIRLLEAQRMADIGGAQARIVIDDDQDRELSGLEIEAGQ